METQKTTKNPKSTEASVREQLYQEIDQAPDKILEITLEFLLFLKSRSSDAVAAALGACIRENCDSLSEASEKSDRTSDEVSAALGACIQENADLPYRPASGKSLVNYQGGWAGDDFDQCLQQVHDSRSKVNFSKHEPF